MSWKIQFHTFKFAPKDIGVGQPLELEYTMEEVFKTNRVSKKKTYLLRVNICIQPISPGRSECLCGTA